MPQHNKTCLICSNNFISVQSHAKFCSDECRKANWNQITGRTITCGKIPSNSVGAMSELVVCAELLKLGYSVFRSVSPSCFCDVIAFKDKKIFKLEIRTGYMAPTGRLNFPTNISEDADIFAVYERNSGKIYFLTKEKEFIDLD